MKWSEVYGAQDNTVQTEDISGTEDVITTEQQNMTEDKTTVLLEQRKSFTDIPAYEIVGLDRSDVTIVQEEVDKSNQYGGEPFRDGVYYAEVDSLTEIFDGYDGSFIVTGDTSFGEEMYGASQHDYEIEIFNARST